MSVSRFRPTVAMAMCWLATGACLGTPLPQPPSVPDIPVTRVDRLRVTALGEVGRRLVAAGERGHILYSDNQAASWRDASSPATASLTAIRFSDGIGLAIGHDGTVLRSEDNGKTWRSITLTGLPDPPALFDLYLHGKHAIAIGSFATYLESHDAGKTWQLRKIVSGGSDDGDFDWHLYGIAMAHPGVLMIVGEAGTLLRSRDDGRTWQVLKGPYDGSYFGILSLHNGSVIAYGMRGHAYRSDDDGEHWRPLDLGHVTSALQGASELADGSILLYGNDGVVGVQEKGIGAFRIERLADRRTVTAMLAVGDRLLDAGPSGIHWSDLGGKAP